MRVSEQSESIVGAANCTAAGNQASIDAARPTRSVDHLSGAEQDGQTCRLALGNAQITLPLFQDVARDYPTCSDDVCQVSVVIT